MTRKILSFFTIILILAAACQKRKVSDENQESAVNVLIARVCRIPVPGEISLSGNIEGSKTVRLGFLVAGKIDFISASEGQMVSKGQLLSRLDPSSYNIAMELADIQVSQIQDEYNRLKIMHDSNSLSESDFSKIYYGLQQARAQQKLHAKNLSDTRLYSPIDGILIKKLAEVGEITGVGTPLFVVSDIRKIKVNAFIPESELHKIRLGQKAAVRVSSLPDEYPGRITEVGAAADPASRAFSLKIEVDNPGMLIRPGMIAEVKIITETDNEILAVPASAIRHDLNNQSYIFIADTVCSRAFRRDVIPGEIIDGNIAILSGLNEGDIIITGGQHKLADGSLISFGK